MKNIVSIILLNYNWKQFNKDCIDSTLVQNYQDFEIIFVDQCSTDWSLEEVENIYKKEIKSWKIKIVKNSENNWFTWWNNLWVKYANKNSKYICLLNNDTIVQKDWLEKLVQSIEKDNKLWAVSCLILDKWHEKDIKEQILKKWKKYVSSVFWEIVYIDMDNKEFDSHFFNTTFLSWCCFMYKKSIVNIPFPWYYFAYAEDLYLSRFTINKWYKLWVCFDTYINHYGSWSFGKRPSKLKLFHWNKNQIINYILFYPFLYIILLFPLFVIKEIAHLFMWVPFERLKAKAEWCTWILKNYSKIRETKKKLNENRKIWYYKFLKQQEFCLSNPLVVENNILRILIYFWNFIFLIYGKFVLFLLSIYYFFVKDV